MMVLDRDVASGADRHLDITFGMQVVDSSSLVSVLFREAFNHPYISFFHLLVNSFCVIIIIIILIINFFRRVFSECTEANATSLIPLDIILPEICVFIIGFSCTVWTKMRRSLAGSLADGLLSDAILIPPRPLIPPTNIRKVRGPQKSTDTSNTKTILLAKDIGEMLTWKAQLNGLLLFLHPGLPLIVQWLHGILEVGKK